MKRATFLIAAVGIFLLTSHVQAAISFDAAASSFQSNVTSSSIPFTTSGVNRMLLVGITADLATDKVSTVTYNGVSMTRLAAFLTPADRWTYLYSLLNPAIGAHNVVVSLSGTSNIATINASYDGVLQLGQPNATSSATSTNATSTNASVTTKKNGDWVAMFVDNSGAGQTPNNAMVLRNNNGIEFWDSNRGISPFGAFNVTTTGGLSGWGTIMASFSAAAVGQVITNDW